MAVIARGVLTADQMAAIIMAPPGGIVGLNLGGTWVGTVTFYGSFDGVNFVPASLTPYPNGTAVGSATANGSWFSPGANYVAFKVVFTRTSGSVTVTQAIAQDSSWQDAYLAATSKYVSQSAAGGAQNQITIAGQANRAQRCRTLSVGMSVAAAAAVDIKITDGASSVLWEGYVPPSTNGISGGGTFDVPLPRPDPAIPGSGGVVGTPGNSLVITLAAPGGSVVSTVNAEIATA